jgi:hypothetical protein
MGPGRREGPSPHFIVSVAQGSGVVKVRSLTEICGSKWSPNQKEGEVLGGPYSRWMDGWMVCYRI